MNGQNNSISQRVGFVLDTSRYWDMHSDIIGELEESEALQLAKEIVDGKEQAVAYSEAV